MVVVAAHNQLHKKCEAWLAEKSYRRLLKTKLAFLVKHANNWDDFKQKAAALNIAVDDSRKYVTYRLTESAQERPVRDRSLKDTHLMRDAIAADLSANNVTMTLEDVQRLWEQQEHLTATHKQREIEMTVEDWQVEKESSSYLYVNVDFGLNREQAVKVPAQQVDKLDNGDYKLFLKHDFQYYLVDPDDPEKNRFMRGSTLAKNIQNQSGNVLLYSDNASVKLKQILAEFEFLIDKGIEFEKSFEEIGIDLRQTFEDTEELIDTLDDKIMALTQKNKAKPSSEALATIKNMMTRRDRLKKQLFEVKKDITLYQKSVKRADAYDHDRKKHVNDRPSL